MRLRISCVALSLGIVSQVLAGSADVLKDAKLSRVVLLNGTTVDEFLSQAELSEKLALQTGRLQNSRELERANELQENAKNFARRQVELKKTMPVISILGHSGSNATESPSLSPSLAELSKFPNEEIYAFKFERRDDITLLDWRLYNFIEAPGKKLLNDYEAFSKLTTSGSYKGYGFDYTVHDIVLFYNQAQKLKIALNPWEKSLQETLLKLGLIRRKNGSFELVKDAAIIGSLRNETHIMDHEINHGVYFTDAEYRKHADLLFASLGAKEKDILAKFLKSEDYDHSDHSLMAREVVAIMRDWETLLKYYIEPSEEERSILRQLHLRVRALDLYSRYYRGTSSALGAQPQQSKRPVR